MKRLLFILLFMPISLHAANRHISGKYNRFDTSALNLNFQDIDTQFFDTVNLTSTQTIRGFKYFFNNVRALNDSSINLGEAGKEWLGVFTDTLTVTRVLPIRSTAAISQTVVNGTFSDVLTNIAAVTIVTPEISNVFVSASCDVRGATKTFRIFIRRDSVTQTSGPYQSMPDTNRYSCSTSFADPKLAAGTYAYQLWAQNTVDTTALTVGDVIISVFAAW